MIHSNSTPILIVDDDPIFCQSLRIVLDQVPHEWLYYEAGNVQDAIALLSEHAIELAIVDINLPDGTAADIIRTAGAVPCLLCTQDDKEPTFKKMFADPSISQNIVGYLTKPLQQGAIWSIRAGLEIGRERQMRSRLLAEATAGLEEERQLIAQNLHDAMGASITQLMWIFASIQQTVEARAVEPPLPDKVRSLCSQGKKILSDAHAEISQAITRLHPEAVSIAGLHAAIEDMVTHWKRTAPTVYFELAISGDLEKVDSRRAGIIYRLVQEGITNVMRHTDPISVRTNMTIRDQTLVLVIASKGQILVERDTYKLTILRARTLSLGGVLQFSCDASREQTCLTINIPI